MEIRCGRKLYTLNKGIDVFMDNGSCIQLLTQKGPRKGWSYTTIRVPKIQWKKLQPFLKEIKRHQYNHTVKLYKYIGEEL